MLPAQLLIDDENTSRYLPGVARFLAISAQYLNTEIKPGSAHELVEQVHITVRAARANTVACSGGQA